MKLPAALHHNLPWKAGSLFLAILTWAVIHASIGEDPRPGDIIFGLSGKFEVPITVRTAAGDTRGFTLQPDKVEVEVRGPGDEVRRLQISQIEASVDLVNVTDFSTLKTRVGIRLPPGFRTLRVVPTQVQVERLPTPAAPPLTSLTNEIQN